MTRTQVEELNSWLTDQGIDLISQEESDLRVGPTDDAPASLESAAPVEGEPELEETRIPTPAAAAAPAIGAGEVGSDANLDSLRLYLRSIGQVDLLTAQQEVELAKRIERGDMEAKRQMVEANLRLV
ncbi:MAG: RNA polymerase sigma factor RpoD, partial [Solirubrobacterales bacterium]|nr:RNA polymerase sigma factor RpoD [Solirubrobacterales bacterium]